MFMLAAQVNRINMDYAGSPPSYTPSASTPYHADGSAPGPTLHPPSGPEQNPPATGQADQHEQPADHPQPGHGTPNHVQEKSPEQQEPKQPQQQKEIFVMDDTRPPPNITQGGSGVDMQSAFACFVCVCCNLPLGLLALYLASQYTLITSAKQVVFSSALACYSVSGKKYPPGQCAIEMPNLNVS